MIDYIKVGGRIAEHRRMLKISQSRMADELQGEEYGLSLYQADISSMENGKSGSGITDLNKLEKIAQYLGIPLETLLFGVGGEQLQKYYGDKMQLRRSDKKPAKAHLRDLSRWTGCAEKDLQSLVSHECGPYTIYTMLDILHEVDPQEQVTTDGVPIAYFPLPVLRTWVFYNTEPIATMTTAVTKVMQHVFQPAMERLRIYIPEDVMNPMDVFDMLNPYERLSRYPIDQEEQELVLDRMYQRMDDLRALGEDNQVLYIESAYVCEDYRRIGILRMLIDYLWLEAGGKDDTLIWINMEPTSGAEIEEYHMLPIYSTAGIGQFKTNEVIAERLGFTVEGKTYHREAQVLGADGEVQTQQVQMHKHAYYLPQKYRDLLAQDQKLVESALAREQLIEGVK